MRIRRTLPERSGGGSLALVAALIGLTSAESLWSCAPAPPPNVPVAIASESAVIVWDAKTKTQHFIRRASFATKAHDFGFLVPTPTKPTLAEADNEVFKTLADITKPVVVQQPRPSNFSCGCGDGKVRSDAPKVTVLEEKRVAGYDAAILEADDAGALANWLKEHGYDFAPNLKDWAAHYIQAGWKFTAFKIAKDAPEEERVGSSAVRMSFQTEKPFFPYREPEASAAEQASASRLLRVFFLGDTKASGTLGEQGKDWPGKVVWANQLGATDQQNVLKQLKLPGTAPGGTWWLTEFEDWSSPRPGTADVYFATAADQQPVARPPHIQYVSRSVPDCVACYALALALLGLSFGRRRFGR